MQSPLLVPREVGSILVLTPRYAKIESESDVGRFKTELTKAAEGHSQIVVDCSPVTFLSSACLNCLGPAHFLLQGKGGKLVFHSVGPGILEVFKITKLNKMLIIRTDEAAALAQFQS